MKKILILILCCLVGGVKAQSFCEVDSVYTMFDRETGYKVFETSDGAILSIGFSGLNGATTANFPKLTVTKFDKCGTVLWRFFYDSLTTCSNCIGVVDLWEQNEGSIVFSAYYVGNFNKLYKINSNGQLVWSKEILDGAKDDRPIGCMQLNENRYLYMVDQFKSNSINGMLYIVDSTGEKIYNYTLPSNSQFFDFFKRQNNTILILGGTRKNSNDPIDSVWTIILDSNLNLVNKNKSLFYTKNNTYYSIHSDGELLLTYNTNLDNDSLNLKLMDLEGRILKDTSYIGKFPRKGIVKRIEKNRIILVDHPIRILNSSLSTIWVEDTTYSLNRISYDAVISSDSIVFSVGNGARRQVGVGNFISDFWLGAKKLSVVWAKKLQIIGVNFINQNSDSIQLSAEILPSTATNKIINWSIDDTSKAFITQTGLLTAKANGVVTVVAKTTDGSNLSASKQITITNQGVGLMNFEDLIQNIDVYPNPAESSVSVKSDFVKINWVQLLDIHSKTVASVKNSENIDISGFVNGYYFLKIETEKGTVFKKLMINK